jgi:hypothetical protein
VDLDRPVLHCLAGLPRVGCPGIVKRLKLVTLEEAAALKAEGWWIVGPDPDDAHALAMWERLHRPEDSST